jgi:V/A-type H+/Na+-transporting ATPase subunit G/H
MLKKIITELKDTENEAEKIIEDARLKAKRMMQDEKDKHEKNKNKISDQWNQKGQEMVEERTKKAHQNASDIHDNCKKEKDKLRNSFKSRKEEAIKMILNNLVK